MRHCTAVLSKEKSVELNSSVLVWRVAVDNKNIFSGPGLYLMYRPVFEILSYLGGLPGTLAIADSESHRNGAFGGTVALVNMAVDGADLAETLSADPTVL